MLQQVTIIEEGAAIMMMKGKRSKRPRPSTSPPPSLELNSMSTTTTTTSSSDAACGINNNSNHSSDYSGEVLTHDEEDMANCLILLATSGRQTSSQPQPRPAAGEEVYKCKTCEKSFSSFQALGGHRASHKKSDKAAATTTLLLDHHQFKSGKQQVNSNFSTSTTMLSLQISNRSSSSSSGGILLGTNKSSRVHECSLCGAEFGSGQALGGHMRRHRPITVAPPPTGGDQLIYNKRPRNNDMLSLDLNLPAPEEQASVIVFSPSPLLHCHY